jgi:hypothetical protein
MTNKSWTFIFQNISLIILPFLMSGCTYVYKKKPTYIYDEKPSPNPSPVTLEPIDDQIRPAVMLSLPTLNFWYFDGGGGHGRYLTAGKCNEVVVEAFDETGWPPLPLKSIKSIELKTSSASGIFYTDKECSQAITSTTIGPDSLRRTFFYKDPLVGELTLTVNDTSDNPLWSAASTITMTANAGLVFTTPTLNQKTTDCGHVTIEAQNSSGTAQIQSSPLALNLHSNSLTGVFYSDSACSNKIPAKPVPKIEALLVQTNDLYYVTTIEAGASSNANIYYKDPKAGSPELSGTEDPRQKFTNAKMAATIRD